METTSQEERDSWSTKLAKKRFIKYLTSLLQIKSSTDKQNAESNATSATSVTLQEVREFPLNNRQTAVDTVVISIEDPACRICQETRNRKGKNRLVAPCGCKGSTKYVHRKCLQKWCATKKTAECEICHHPYNPQFLKAPGLSKSDENSIVSSTMVFCLLLGVFGVSLYLLFAHLSTVESIFKGDSWLLLSLVAGSFCGFCLFLYWFVRNLSRILTRKYYIPEAEIRGSDPVPLSIIATGT
ncbi:E3 ubiquitin-protein ligase MARCHF1-like isoform X2 [Apostichopus japonicus]